MFKKSGVEKRLRKISRQEAESVKLLEKQVTLPLALSLLMLRYSGATIREGSPGKREAYREKFEQSLPWGTEDPAGGRQIEEEII